MKNIEFEQKCKNFFEANHSYLNQNYKIIFVYDILNQFDFRSYIMNIDEQFENWYGHCSQKYETIFINMRNDKTTDFMYEVFIHEMAHSMQFKLSHNKEFADNVRNLGGQLTSGGEFNK